MALPSCECVAEKPPLERLTDIYCALYQFAQSAEGFALWAQPVLVLEGDSLTTDEYIAAEPEFVDWEVVNAATAGNEISTITAQYPFDMPPFYSAARTHNIIVLWAGTNDLTNGQATATIEGNLASFVTQAHATGFQVVIMTILPSATHDVTEQGRRLAVNAWIVAGSSGADAIVDPCALPQFDSQSDTSNPTYFTDGTHLTPAAYALITPLIVAGINSLTSIEPTLGTIAGFDRDNAVIGFRANGNASLLLGAIRFFTADGISQQGNIGWNETFGSWWMLGSAMPKWSIYEPSTNLPILTASYTEGTRVILPGQSGFAAEVTVAGSLNDGTNTASTGNVGAGEDTLRTYSLVGNSLGANGQALRFMYAGTAANNGNAKRLRLKFGGTTIFDSGAGGIPAGAAMTWSIEGEIIRTGAATQKAIVRVTTSSATQETFCSYATAAETLSGAVVLLLTGEAVSNDDLVCELSKLHLEA